MRRIPIAGLLLALVSAAAFGSGGAIVRPLLDGGWTPGAASLLRAAGAAALLALPAWFALRGRWGAVAAQWPRIAVYGGVSIAGTQLLYYLALERIPVGTALMIEYLAPVLLVAAVAVRHRVLPSPGVLLGAGLAIGGLALVLDLGGSAPRDLLGVLYALGAAVTCATYFALAASIRLPAIGLAGLGMLAAAATTTVAVLLGLVPFRISAAPVVLGGAEMSPLVPLALVVVIATVLAYVTGILGAVRLGGRRASFVALSEVLFAVLAAAVLVGEVPGPVQLAGAGVLLTGVLLVLRDRGAVDSGGGPYPVAVADPATGATVPGALVSPPTGR